LFIRERLRIPRKNDLRRSSIIHANDEYCIADAHAHHHHHPVGEVSWNPAQVCVDFQVASAILSDRGLKVATKWIAELWMGLPPEIIDTTTTGKYDTNHHDGVMMTCSIPDRLHVVSETNPAVAYAKSLLDLGEYAHAGRGGDFIRNFFEQSRRVRRNDESPVNRFE
jgi:hypothetical protein